MKIYFLLILIFCGLNSSVFAQEFIDVTFRYYPSSNAVRSFVPGSFNNWGNNSAGRISTTDASLLTVDAENGFSFKTVRLQVGGGTLTNLGARGYAYKFHEQYNNTGSNWDWFTDPLNSVAIGPNSDSFIEVTNPLVFQLQPANNSVHQDEPPAIWATVASTENDPIDVLASKIWVNDVEVSSLEGYYLVDRQLLFVESISDLGVTLNRGTNSLRIVAATVSGDTSTVKSTFSFISDPEVVRESRPAALEDGVTVDASTTGQVSFSLFAPGKEFVYVIGDHSNWEIEDEYLMKLDEARADSAHFWLTIDGLEDGTYRFQYVVDGDLRIADLFSEQILDPDLDRYITSSVHPGMPVYPTGKTTGVVGVFEIGAEEYNWQIPDFDRPLQHDLVIYELLLRDFVEESTFEILRDTLDYLERLGVNAIELMPVSNFDGNDSWGYNPNFHGALDKSYGTRESFKQFVDEAHSRGIAVILDVVYNHAQDKSPLIQLYGPNRAENPFLGPGHAYNVFFHLNHDHPYIRYWVDRMNKYWLDTYNIDGYRFDLTKGYAPNVNNLSLLDGYNADRIRNLKRMADELWAHDSEVYIILEHFAAGTEEKELAEYRTDEPGINGMMLWGNMNHTYNEGTMGYFNNANFSGGYFGSRGWKVPNLITYMESHDEQWLMFKNLKFGACTNAPGGGSTCDSFTSSYNVRNLSTALDRQKLAGAFFFTIPGPKMMWQFGELGYGGEAGECLKPGTGNGSCLSTDPGRTGRKPIRWEYASDRDRSLLYRTWAALIHLRRSYDVFNSPDTEVSFANTGAVKVIRLVHPSMQVTIVGNFSVVSQTSNVIFATPATTWYDYFSGNSLKVDGTSASLSLAPGEYKIYTSKSLPKPNLGEIPTSVDDAELELPQSFNLYQNYPNPFNPSTTISYDVAEAGFVRIQVFDIIGREIKTLINTEQLPGTYTVLFHADNLGSGTYLIRMEASGRIFARKMTLVK